MGCLCPRSSASRLGPLRPGQLPRSKSHPPRGRSFRIEVVRSLIGGPRVEECDPWALPLVRGNKFWKRKIISASWPPPWCTPWHSTSRCSQRRCDCTPPYRAPLLTLTLRHRCCAGRGPRPRPSRRLDSSARRLLPPRSLLLRWGAKERSSSSQSSAPPPLRKQPQLGTAGPARSVTKATMPRKG